MSKIDFAISFLEKNALPEEANILRLLRDTTAQLNGYASASEVIAVGAAGLALHVQQSANKASGVIESPPTLEEDFRRAINSHSRENASDTPDSVLAQYLIRCLLAYEDAINERKRYFTKPPAIAGST